jgi:rare lipoprotein A
MTAGRLAMLAGIVLLVAACATTPKAQPGEELKGLASWYGQEYAGRTTANGEIFDPMKLTAAHRTLPFGTLVNVRNPKNDRSVAVRINDRGPFVGNRIIDLSYAAALQIELVEAGVGPVEMKILKVGAGAREAPEPFVVALPTPAEPIRDPVNPPPVEFPLPDSAATPAAKERPAASSPAPFRVEREEVRAAQAPAPKPAAPVEAEQEVEPQRETQPRAEGFVLQVGAFQSEANALQLHARVSETAPNAFLQLANGMHRVRVGPFETKAAAIDAQEKLEGAGIPSILLAADK